MSWVAWVRGIDMQDGHRGRAVSQFRHNSFPFEVLKFPVERVSKSVFCQLTLYVRTAALAVPVKAKAASAPAVAKCAAGLSCANSPGPVADDPVPIARRVA